LNVTDFNEGKDAYEAYKKQSGIVETLRVHLEEILEGEVYKELESLARTNALAKVPRATAAIAKEQGEVGSKISQTESDTESKTAQLRVWAEEYKSQDRLLDLLVERRAELRDIEKELQNLRPLPESVKDPERFIKEFEEKQESLNSKEGELSEVRIERATLEGQAPEETTEEIEAQWKEAQSRFEQVEKEADAINEVHNTFQQIKSTMDAQTLDPWLDELQRVVVPLTVDRYRMVLLTKDDPGKAARADGLEIPFQVLSMGTMVGLGLALRLSMARYFLKDLEGFLVLDDPLVDMDSERQEAAARVIQHFAKEKQVILLTCHANHANLLGGHVTSLQVPA